MGPARFEQSQIEIFLGLIKEDIDFIINTDPIDDDCPCSELIFDMEKKLEENVSSVDFQSILGMLSLYCDISKSIDYFQYAQSLDPDRPTLKSVLTFLNTRYTREENRPDIR